MGAPSAALVEPRSCTVSPGLRRSELPPVAVPTPPRLFPADETGPQPDHLGSMGLHQQLSMALAQSSQRLCTNARPLASAPPDVLRRSHESDIRSTWNGHSSGSERRL